MSLPRWRRLTLAWTRQFGRPRPSVQVARPYLESLGRRDLPSASQSLHLVSQFVPFSLPTPNALPLGITAGPDGALWFAESGADQIGRITLDGTITEFALPAGSRPERITAGPDGAIWFTEPGRNLIGRLLPAVAPGFTEYAIPTPNSDPQGITAGP